mmetsp:Transcript_27110/g.44231  ORF Transcript_27110/g.44231 Transcript_27110/m.44231 type:complete len:94 (-) Transcript_27110:2123-2404(-)
MSHEKQVHWKTNQPSPTYTRDQAELHLGSYSHWRKDRTFFIFGPNAPFFSMDDTGMCAAVVGAALVELEDALSIMRAACNSFCCCMKLYVSYA